MTKTQQAGESNTPLFNLIPSRKTMQERKVWRVSMLEKWGAQDQRVKSKRCRQQPLYSGCLPGSKVKSNTGIHLLSTWFQALPRDPAEH